MPSKLTPQQKFFAKVYAFQKGRLPADKASDAIKAVANSVTPEEIKRFAKADDQEVKEIMRNIIGTRGYFEHALREAATSDYPVKIKGKYIDSYTAKLILLTLDNLTENNKRTLLENTMDEIVALSYKIITH